MFNCINENPPIKSSQKIETLIPQVKSKIKIKILKKKDNKSLFDLPVEEFEVVAKEGKARGSTGHPPPPGGR